MKNEQKTDEMIEILEHLQRYCPRAEFHNSPIAVVGDQLTCERIRAAKRARVQQETPEERFEQIIETPADWHALVTFYEVYACMRTSVTYMVTVVYIIYADYLDAIHPKIS
jgi:hypothetical protein